MRSLAAIVASAFAAPVLAATFAGVEVPAPPPVRNVPETYWGTPVDDPYRFFEEVKDPAVQAWMKAQANATESILAKIPGRDAFLERIKAIESKASGLTDQAVRVASGRYFFLKRDPADNQFRLVWRDKAGDSDRLIVDPEELRKKTGTTHAILDFAPSPDGKRIAYAMQTGGSEIGHLHIVDVKSGKALVEPIDRIRYAGVSWLDDGSGFFYSRLREGYEKLPPTEKFNDRARHFRTLEGGDRNVFSPSHNPELALPVYAGGYTYPIPGWPRAATLVYHGVERYRAFYLADLASAKAGTAKWRQVVGLEDQAADIDKIGRAHV